VRLRVEMLIVQDVYRRSGSKPNVGITRRIRMVDWQRLAVGASKAATKSAGLQEVLSHTHCWGPYTLSYITLYSHMRTWP
jgi:hypothetical protein